MLARELISLHESPHEVAPFSERYPGLSAEAGYQAAEALHQHRVAAGWRPVGRKIGFTNRTIWPRYGVYEPIWGTVYDRTVQHGVENRARVALAGLVNPRIEPEICFCLRASPRDRPLLDCIEWMAHSVEIVQCHHPAWKVTLADSTANNGLHGRLIVGTPAPLPGDARSALARTEVRLFRGEELVDSGMGENVLGNPIAALEHLVGVLAKHGARPLAAGEIITTGTITDAHPVASGEIWRTQISGVALAGLTIEFT